MANEAEDYLAFVRLWHTVNGLYIWEFFTSLDYEWDVFRGHRQYLRTIWVYSLTRVATLMAVVVNMIGLDAVRPINCQVWVDFELAFAYLAVASATLLIVLRTMALWDRNKIVIMVAMGIWLTNVSFLIHGALQIRSSWALVQGTCALTHTDGSRQNILATLSADVILLLIMLLGLYRHSHTGMSGLLRLLWTQGIIWLLLATLAEVPPTVFIFLNINVPFNVMFQTPALVTVSIAATRMYRSLTNFRSAVISQDGLQRPSRLVSGTKQLVFVEPIQLNRKEVPVYTTSEQYLESQAGQCNLSIKEDGQTV